MVGWNTLIFIRRLNRLLGVTALIGVIADLALVPDGKYEHRVFRFLIAIQRHVAGLTARYEQLVQLLLCWPADQRVVGKNLYRFTD